MFDKNQIYLLLCICKMGIINLYFGISINVIGDACKFLALLFSNQHL